MGQSEWASERANHSGLQGRSLDREWVNQSRRRGGRRKPIRVDAGGNRSGWWVGDSLTHQAGVGAQRAEKEKGSLHPRTVNLGLEV